MHLAPGTRLGPYEIVAPLGAGGMGEVYRAADTRLGRDVAVKVLPQHLSGNPEVRARFEREAKTVSSLNHPHICTLFDVGREGDTDFLVMELIQGESLAQRLSRGALPVAEALRLGGQIADALDRAHRAGVVHRDLKPGNVMLTRSGAKLMDFGLARATGLAGPSSVGGSPGAFTQSPTMAAPLTAEGSIVGTFQYMAPEQLEGREADSRSDIWALGCVLYEMGTGKRPFEGRSQASLISAIMEREPVPIAQIAPLAPAALDRLVRQCLAKDPDERIQSAHDVKLQLAGLADGGAVSGPAAPAGSATAGRARPLAGAGVAWGIAAFASLAALSALVLLLAGRGPNRRPLRSVIAAPPGAHMHLAGDDGGPPVLSPDGTKLVFGAIGQGGGARLWLRRMDELTARPLPGTEGGVFPFWSPDGRSIGFFTPTHLKRLDLDGGAVVSLAPVSGSRGGSWSRSGVILYTPGYLDGLMRIPASGGTPAVVTTLDRARETTHRWPQMLPDGQHFIYLSAKHDDPGASAIWYGALSGDKPRKLLSAPSSAVAASGWVLFVRDSTLMAQRFDPGSGRLSGVPMSTAEVVQVDPSTWRTVLTASDNDLLVYGLGGRTAASRITWFDRSGQPQRRIGESANHLNIALSPDDRQLVVETQYTPNADLWSYDLATGVRRPLTRTSLDETCPIWSPDGAWIVYADRLWSGKTFSQVQMIRSSGLGEPRLILGDSTADVTALSWSRDGSDLLVGRGPFRGGGAVTLWRITLANRKVEPVLPASQPVTFASFSPDARWIAYSSLATGRSEVFVIPAPRTGEAPDTTVRQWPVTSGGGDKPVWRGDSRELYYMRPDGTLMALAVDGAGGEFRVLSESALFQAFQRPFVGSYDVTADGQHFAVVVEGTEGGAPLAVVTDWTKALRGR